jgi:glycosyltransferase involved in cell wall biosynthesis
MARIPSTPAVMVVTSAISDSFMRDDLRILHGFVRVVLLEVARLPAPGGRFVGKFFRGAISLAYFLYRLFRYDVRAVVFWFATPTYAPLLAFVGKLLGARILVITGGFDAVYVPDIDWGSMKRPWHRLTFGLLMKVADVVLPFSDSARRLIAGRDAPKRMRTAYPSIDVNYFVPSGIPRCARVITCCYRYGERNIVQKGLDQFVAVAKLLPDVSFVMVGNGVDEAAQQLATNAPPNLRVSSRIPGRGGYRDLLTSSSVYAQLSAYEGFGVSVAEAMACGCVPVVADRYSLPEVVGETGFIVPYGDAQRTARAIRNALESSEEARCAARSRVAERFDRSKRVKVLREELARLLPELRSPPIRIELGCGSTGVAGAIGVDARRTIQTSAVCDVRNTCFRNGIADEIYSFCVLEHLEDPYELMEEVVRVLKPQGRAYLRVPNLGTYSAHLDMTHRFLADLRIWRGIMEGYFESVAVVPEGTKYRDNRFLTLINRVFVRGLRFHELAQGWTFVCGRKRANPVRFYQGWWQERELDR